MSSIITAIGFDFGRKFIGLAYGQSITKTAEPIGILRASRGIPNWNELDKMIALWQPGHLVVGLPLDKEKQIGDSAKAAQAFLLQIESRYQLPTHSIDESYSSLEAIQSYPAAKKAKTLKQPMDGFAAKIILESWLNSLE